MESYCKWFISVSQDEDGWQQWLHLKMARRVDFRCILSQFLKKETKKGGRKTFKNFSAHFFFLNKMKINFHSTCSEIILQGKNLPSLLQESAGQCKSYPAIERQKEGLGCTVLINLRIQSHLKPLLPQVFIPQDLFFHNVNYKFITSTKTLLIFWGENLIKLIKTTSYIQVVVIL